MAIVAGIDSGTNKVANVEVTDGGLHTHTPGAVGTGVVGSDYAADRATSTASAAEAIPTGATSLYVENLSNAAAEVIRFRFGDATVTATTNTGWRLSAGSTASAIAGPTYLSVPVPPGATHWAYNSLSGTPTMATLWGG